MKYVFVLFNEQPDIYFTAFDMPITVALKIRCSVDLKLYLKIVDHIVITEL